MLRKHLTDERVEVLIANLLRGGVLTAALVVIAGAILYLGAHPRAHVSYHTFHSEPQQLKSVTGVIGEAFTGNARGIIQLGLLLLIATPIARVAFSVVAFAIEEDKMYIVFTLIVLGVLLYSLFGSSTIT